VEVYDYLLASDIKWDFVLIQLNYVDWKHASGFNVNADYCMASWLKKESDPWLWNRCWAVG
jgi:predicted aldo/keto reductase-like oxidoreductase